MTNLIKIEESSSLDKLNEEIIKSFWELKDSLIYEAEVSDEDIEKDVKKQLEQFLKQSLKKVADESRRETIELANSELNEVINKKTIKYPPKYGVRLPNRPIPMEEQMFMCEEVAWRRIIEKLSITNKEVKK